MGKLYLTQIADVFRGAGLAVVEYGGWQTRARSSGGFDAMPLCVMWHHTASSASPEADANYCCHGSSDRPICNVLIARDGTVWLLAAGATNTNGKGNSQSFSRGTVPADSMNTRAFGMEICNNGVGEPYPQAQIDAAFRASEAANGLFGNQVTDVCTHQHYAPTRKIDPATNTAVQGGWQPSSVTSSKSWSLDDLRAECSRRAHSTPQPPDPIPTPTEDDDMIRVDYGVPGTDSWWARMLIGGVGITWVQGHANDTLDDIIPAHLWVANDQHMVDLLSTFKAIGPPPSTWASNKRLCDAWKASAAK